MFIDKVKIFIKAGNGGKGGLSFHREKYVAQGGPDGGNGGKGGDIIFKVKPELNNLVYFHYSTHFKASNGEEYIFYATPNSMNNKRFLLLDTYA